MNTTIRTYETRNNTYHVVRIAKTSYEEQQEQREKLLLLTLQKIAGVLLIILSTMFSIKAQEGTVLIIGLLIGLVCIFSKKIVFE